MTKTYIFNLISILLGFIYIFFILWNRLIREHILRDLTGTCDIYTYIIYCILFLSSIILFLYYIKKIFNIQTKYRILSKILEINIIQKIVDFVLEYILKAPYNSYLWVYNTINLLPLVEKIGVYFWNRDPYKDPYKIYILCCICRLIILLCFFIDVFISHKFNYFYKSLILLLFYLICNSIIFILKDISFYNRKYITDNYITVQSDLGTNAFNVDFVSTYDGDRSDQMLHNHYTVWLCYLANCMFADAYYEYVDKYNKYINVIYYGIFTLGWAYIVFQSYS